MPTLPLKALLRWPPFHSGLWLWLFLACCFPLMDTDFWWHLRTGELIFQRGFPDLDWYTFTDFDKPWIDLHWGFQVLVALVYRVGGASGVVLVKAGILALALAVAMSASAAFRNKHRNPVSSAAQILLWMLPAITISGRGYERPEMLSLLFLALWLWIVDRSSNEAEPLSPIVPLNANSLAGFESAGLDPALMWWLPLLQVVWTNCHALSVLGLVTGACLAVDWGVRRLWFAVFPRAKTSWFGPPPDMSPQFLLGVGMLTGGAAFLNPWLEEGAFFPLVLYRKFSVDQKFYSANIGEFQRPYDFYLKHGLTNNYLAAEVFLWGLTALSFLFLLTRKRCNVFRVLMFAGFSNLAWAASRNTNIFSLVVGYLLVANFRELMVTTPVKVSPASPWLGARGRFWAIPAALLLAVMIPAVVSGAWGRWTGEYKTFGLGERPTWFMHAASKFAGQRGFPRHAFIGHNGQAAVYIYHNSPPALVFMDARLEVSTQVTFERYLTLLARIGGGDMNWADPLRDDVGRLPVVVLDSRYSRLQIAAMLSFPNWRLVYADKTGAVFLDAVTANNLKLPAVSFEPLRVPPVD